VKRVRRERQDKANQNKKSSELKAKDKKSKRRLYFPIKLNKKVGNEKRKEVK
jgi:hypothetical protein